ncbi:MAG: hypothetical protein E7304_03295 [Butyrivibrio sp.]|nr:hypothetical protein [Butyrivibrio sp.]
MGYAGRHYVMEWEKTIYTDGSSEFVSGVDGVTKDPSCLDICYLGMGQPIVIRIRVISGAPINDIYIRLDANGEIIRKKMKKGEVKKGFQYYYVVVISLTKQLKYRFIIYANTVKYYTQIGVLDNDICEMYDFKVLFDYKMPEWVINSVFYQIVPDRFAKNDKDKSSVGEKVKYYLNWDETPMSYEEGKCRDYYGGTLDGICGKIKYLSELGINAVYLTPIFEALSSHRYDTIDYDNVDAMLGGNKALERLTRKIHDNGMKIILDAVINHTSSEHRWFKEATLHCNSSTDEGGGKREYYYIDKSGKYLSWNGLPEYPKLNYRSNHLREEIYGNDNSFLKKWTNYPYEIDGWRIDSAAEIGDSFDYELKHEVWKEIVDNLCKNKNSIYLVGEYWNDASRFLQGNMWHATMNYAGCARPIRLLIGDRDILDEQVGRNYNVLNSEKSFGVDNFRKMIMDFYAKIPWTMHCLQFNIIDSHDCYRLHNNCSIPRFRILEAIMIQYMLPGVPCIYYGDEREIKGDIDSPEGIRYPMNWGKSNAEMFAFYQNLNRLRRNDNAFSYGGFTFLDAFVNDKVQEDILVMVRFTIDKMIMFACSFCEKKVNVNIDFESILREKIKNVEILFASREDSYVLENSTISLSLDSDDYYMFRISI